MIVDRLTDVFICTGLAYLIGVFYWTCVEHAPARGFADFVWNDSVRRAREALELV